MEMTADMIALGQDYFEHHGIQGQKWGVRRFQNDDGSLTEAGRKRYYKSVAGNKEATLLKGQSVYRISTNDKSDATGEKIYVSASPESGDFYITNSVGSKKIYNYGKAFVQEYVLNSDLKMPDKKTMEKIELNLLNDKEVQKELVSSLMKKGLSREEATEQVRPYNSLKDVPNKVGNVLVSALFGTWFGTVGSVAATPAVGIPLGIAVATGIHKNNAGEIEKISDRRRALENVRISYGDKNNKILNEKLKNELQKQGYNAMKDYNDRRAFDKKGEHAVIILDSNKNLTFKKSEKVSEKMYGEAYARQYLEDHPKSKLEFNDLVSDGEKLYREFYNKGILDRQKRKENEEYLRKHGGIAEHSLTSSWSNTRWNSYDFDELYHHGVQGQKWGVRKWQYADGTLTPEGKIHYRRTESAKKIVADTVVTSIGVGISFLTANPLPGITITAAANAITAAQVAHINKMLSDNNDVRLIDNGILDKKFVAYRPRPKNETNKKEEAKHSLITLWSNTGSNTDEFYHSGVKKQRWGFRRWQYEDGSLTPAGREHYRKLRLKAMAKGQSADIKKDLVKKSDVEEKPKQKSVENMTDAELKKATNRLALEDVYYQKQRSISSSKAEIRKNTPEPPKSLGKKFTEKLMNDVIVPAATNAGKDYVEKYLKKLGERSLARKFPSNK